MDRLSKIMEVQQVERQFNERGFPVYCARRILPARIVLSVRYQIMVGIAKIRKSKGGKKAKAESGIPV